MCEPIGFVLQQRTFELVTPELDANQQFSGT
jgi:hypothetical protein